MSGKHIWGELLVFIFFITALFFGWQSYGDPPRSRSPAPVTVNPVQAGPYDYMFDHDDSPAANSNGQTDQAKREAYLKDCEKQLETLVNSCSAKRDKATQALTDYFGHMTPENEKLKNVAVDECKLACSDEETTVIAKIPACQNLRKLSHAGVEATTIESKYIPLLSKDLSLCQGADPSALGRISNIEAKADDILKQNRNTYGPSADSYFTYTDREHGTSRCVNVPGQLNGIQCVGLRDLAPYTTSSVDMGSDTSYIPSLQPITTTSVPPTPLIRPIDGTGVLDFGASDSTEVVAPGRADRDQQAAAGTDAVAAAKPTPAPVERPTPTVSPTPTPQQQVQAQNTQGLNGGNMGSLNGSTLNSGNPFSPSPMNWASTNVASNSSSDYNSGSQYSGSEVTSGLGSSATSADLSGGGGSRALSNTRSASADRANSPSNSEPSSLGGGSLSTASSGLGANPSTNNRRSSAGQGGYQASNNSANLLAGAGFYKAPGSRMGGANGAQNLSPAALKNLKARAKKDRLRHCQGNIQCLLVVAGMSDQKFKNLVIKSGNRGIASYFSRRGQPSLPREIGSGMHDAISAAASIINKNITLDEEGDLEYITPENSSY